jgi:hypothetical protein
MRKLLGGEVDRTHAQTSINTGVRLMLLSVRVGRFALEALPGVYVRVPGLGAAHYSRTFGLTCDAWFGPEGVGRERAMTAAARRVNR